MSVDDKLRKQFEKKSIFELTLRLVSTSRAQNLKNLGLKIL